MRNLLLIAIIICFNSFITFGQSNFAITHSPYIQALTDTSVSILWTTDKPAIAWVEIAPDDGSHYYQKERPKYYATAYGFKKVGELHQVNIKNLLPGVKYRYRVYSQEVLKHVGTKVLYGNVVATDVYSKEPLSFTTLSNKKSNIDFLVVNDIHGRNDVFNNLLNVGEVDKNDFVIFNGDMANVLSSEEQMFADFMETATKRFASKIPMFYSRGNHETRGAFAIEYPRYFPTPTDKLYYQFNYGDVGVIVLDCGEDKPDTDIEYANIVQMDDYRTEQALWLEKAIENLEFKNAKYKIVICHMPPFEGWHGQHEILDKFVPILNRSGVQIMLSGHLHKHILQPKNEKIKFPILVNSNNNVIRASITDKKGTFKVLDPKGVVVEEIVLPPLK